MPTQNGVTTISRLDEVAKTTPVLLNTDIYIYVYMYTYIHKYMYIYTRIYTYTYIYDIDTLCEKSPTQIKLVFN